MPLAVHARPFISGERAFEVVEDDQADRHVVQRDADAFGVAEGQELLERPFVPLERVRKTILAVEDVGDVDVEAGARAPVAQSLEDGGRAFRRIECARVIAAQDMGLE